MNRRQKQARMGWWIAGALALVAVLSGCASSPGAWSPANGVSSGKDIVTSSDENDVRKRARIRLELASTYFAQGQYTTALDETKQALAIDPRLVTAIELRGLIYDALGDRARAEDAYRQALGLEPDNASVLHNFGWYQCRQKAYPEADALFARAIQQPMSPTMTKSLLARGVCLMQAGQWGEAEKALTRSYELDSANPATAFNLASVLYRQQEFERARFYIRRVNAVPAQVTAESLWLAVRIEHRLNHMAGRDELGAQLRSRFVGTREANLLELGRFDD